VLICEKKEANGGAHPANSKKEKSLMRPINKCSNKGGGKKKEDKKDKKDCPSGVCAQFRQKRMARISTKGATEGGHLDTSWGITGEIGHAAVGK